MTCAYQIVLNDTRAFSPAEKLNWINAFNALSNDLSNVRSQYALLQAALAAATAPGAGYSTFGLASQQFLPFA